MKNTLKCLMFSLLLVVIAISVGCGTQVPEEGETSRVLPSVDPFIGTWNFHAEESTPELGRKSATRTIEDRGDGFMLGTWETISAQGERAFRQFAAKRDGKDYPVFVLESEAPQSVSIKSIDPYTEEAIEKTDGKATITTTRTISRDGKTMRITVQSASDQGEQTSAVAVYERQSTDPSPFVGTWRLNVEKSTFGLSPGPKSLTRTVEDRGDGVILMTRDGVDDQGNRTFQQYAAKYDGKDYPFPVLGAKEARSIAVKRVDASTVQVILKADGKITSIGTHAISNDNLTLTITNKGTNAEGQEASNLLVLERQ